MGFEVEEYTPQLSLPKLPCKPEEPAVQMPTPPLHPSLSVPFRWEEAPGKPRATSAASKYKAAAAGVCLKLPPRLLHEFTRMPSREAAPVDWPYRRLARSFSFRRGLVSGRDDGLRPVKMGCCWSFGPMRWGGFKGEAKLGRGSIDFSQSLGEIFKREKSVKMPRMRRVRGFLNLAIKKPNF